MRINITLIRMRLKSSWRYGRALQKEDNDKEKSILIVSMGEFLDIKIFAFIQLLSELFYRPMFRWLNKKLYFGKIIRLYMNIIHWLLIDDKNYNKELVNLEFPTFFTN